MMRVLSCKLLCVRLLVQLHLLHVLPGCQCEVLLLPAADAATLDQDGKGNAHVC